jgi:GNAT superfamily N-acetyltransferase
MTTPRRGRRRDRDDLRRVRRTSISRMPCALAYGMATWCTQARVAGESFIVWDDDGTPAATITVDRWANPDLWTPEEAAEPALYAHKLTVARAHAGQGLGAELLDWAGSRAAGAGDRWLRVDVWTTNKQLQDYYRRLGFTHVRTVILAHNPSGALFQRPARHAATPRLREAARSLTAHPK